MTKRLYISSHVPSFQPTLQGAWDTSTANIYREFGNRDGPVASVTQTKSNASTTWDMALTCFVVKFDYSGNIPILSPALDLRYGRVASAASTFVAHWHIWVSTGATSTVRALVVPADGLSGTFWTTSATFQFLGINRTATLAVTAGDYLVIELGVQGQTVSTTDTATIYNGGLGTDPVSGDAVSNQAGWIDFIGATDALINGIPVPGTPMLAAT